MGRGCVQRCELAGKGAKAARWAQVEGANTARCSTIPLGPRAVSDEPMLGRWMQDDYIHMMVSNASFTRL